MTPTDMISSKNEGRFRADSLNGIEAQFHENGYAVVEGLFSQAEIDDLRKAAEIIQEREAALQPADRIPDINDTVFLHERFKGIACDPRIVSLARRCLGSAVELQHSKFNPKPLEDKGGGLVEWHQDYPFFPHTNFDLIAIGLHLDPEGPESGCLQVIPGSHRQGLLSHCKDGKFAYTVTTPFDESRAMKLTGPSGMLTLHHSLMLHSSQPKRSPGQRRVFVFEFRAQDAVQIAGVIWRCTGMQVDEPGPHKGTARFPDGTRVEIRGREGRLFDTFGRLAPDRK